MKLNLSLIRRLSNRLSEIIIRRQIEEENQKGQLGGKDKVVEMDESCFSKEKTMLDVSKNKTGVLDLWRELLVDYLYKLSQIE